MNRFVMAAALLLGGILSGCVSTEALYAEYDEVCPVKASVTDTGMVMVTGLASQSQGQLWEPAVYFGFDQLCPRPLGRRAPGLETEVLQAPARIHCLLRGRLAPKAPPKVAESAPSTSSTERRTPPGGSESKLKRKANGSPATFSQRQKGSARPPPAGRRPPVR